MSTDTNTAPTCWACEGTGTDWGDTCQVCHGEGVAESIRPRTVLGVSIDVPTGHGDGSSHGGSRTAPALATVSFAKLPDGTWGLRGPAGTIVEGADVIVEKRNGSRETHTVGQIVEQSNKYGDTVARIGGPERKASEKQVAFIKRLVAERYDVEALDAAWTDEIIESLTPKAASDAIERLKAMPVNTAAKQATEIEDGFYVVRDEHDGHEHVTVYKVQHAVHGSGEQYAKELVDGTFEYVGRKPLRAIATKGERLSLELAKELGHLYGRCMICGRTLTDEGSIAEGIGPVCAKKL